MEPREKGLNCTFNGASHLDRFTLSDLEVFNFALKSVLKRQRYIVKILLISLTVYSIFTHIYLLILFFNVINSGPNRFGCLL